MALSDVLNYLAAASLGATAIAAVQHVASDPGALAVCLPRCHPSSSSFDLFHYKHFIDSDRQTCAGDHTDRYMIDVWYLPV